MNTHRKKNRQVRRATTTVRAVWGAALLIAPAPLLRATGAPATTGGTSVLRVLGLRQITQSLAGMTAAGDTVARWGPAVDGLHAATGVGLALWSRRWRSAALLDATVAAGFAAAGLAGRTRTSSRHHRRR